MDDVGAPIFFMEQSEEVLRKACTEALSETFEDRELATFIMDRVHSMMEYACQNDKVPVLARVLPDNAYESVFEIAVFLEPEDPRLFHFPIPAKINLEISQLMSETLHMFIALVNGHTDITVCQILCCATNDPWDLINREKQCLA